MALRSFKVAARRPFGLSGVAFLYGYARSVVRRDDRVEDERFRRFVAAELRGRIRPRAPRRRSRVRPKPRKFLRFSSVLSPMAFVDTIRHLWQRKFLVGIVFVVAVFAAIFTAYRVSVRRPGCTNAP